MDNDQKRQAVGRMNHHQPEDQQREQSSQSLTSDNHVPDEPDVTKHGVAEAGTTEPTTTTTTTTTRRTSTPSSTPSTSNTAATDTRLLDIHQEKQAALASRVVQTLLPDDHHNHRDYEREQDGSTTCRPAAPGTNTCTTINLEEERAAARTSVVTLALIPDHQSPQTIKQLQQQHLDNHRENHACSTATATATSLASSSTLNTTIISTNRSLANHPKHQHQQQQLDDAQILQQASLEAPRNQKHSILGPPWTRHPHEYSPQNVIPGAFAAGPLGTVQRDVLTQDLQQQLQQQQQPMAAAQDINTNNNHDEDNNHSNTNNNQLGLVVAQPIHENVEEKNLHQAIPQDMETERERQLQKEESFRKWAIRLTLLMCAVLVIIIVAVALTVPDNPGKTSNDETNGSLTSSSGANNSVTPEASSPTVAPSLSFVLNLPEFTMQAIANNPNSSQALAYDWLEQDPARGNYSEAKQLQRMALATLYYATGGPNWLIQSDWMSYTVDECAWYSKVNVTGTTQASTCDEDGNYLELVLTLNGLAGSLPTELMLLTKLATLDVATNEIGGTIFTEIGAMSTLKALIIDANEIGGTIPTQLGLLTNLEVLICHTLQLEKYIPTYLGQMTSLVNVNIFDNPLMTGILPTELGRLTNLKEFKVYFPFLSGIIPSELGNLVNMDSLDIRGARQLTGSIPSELGRWTKARTFFIEKTMITGTLPTELGQLVMLEELVINGSELTGSVPSEFGLLSSMKRTKLNFNARMGGGGDRGRGIPSELGNLVNLEVLEFIYSPLGASIPSELGRLTLLEQLGLESLMLTGTVPTEVWALSSLSGFSISLNYNLSGNIATEIGLATSLTFLGAYETSLSGSIPSEVGLCAHLKTIYLHNSSLTGSIPSEMAAIADLSHLWIGGNHEMTGTFPYLLANQSNLSARGSTIILNGTQLHGEIPDVLCSAQELAYDCPPMCGCDCPCSE